MERCEIHGTVRNANGRCFWCDHPDAQKTANGQSSEPPKDQLLEKRAREVAIITAAQNVISHWNEFGPEHGFEESIARLEKTLRE